MATLSGVTGACIVEVPGTNDAGYVKVSGDREFTPFPPFPRISRYGLVGCVVNFRDVVVLISNICRQQSGGR